MKSNVQKAAEKVQNMEEGKICPEEGELRSDEFPQREGDVSSVPSEFEKEDARQDAERKRLKGKYS